MPVPYGSCDGPVHENSVKYPHCGQPTGVAADASLTAEERAAAVELARIDSDRYVPRDGGVASSVELDSEVALVAGAAAAAAAIGALVGSAVKAAVEHAVEQRDRPGLPRAVARHRPPPPATPIASTEPEPTLPPADQPRFLK